MSSRTLPLCLLLIAICPAGAAATQEFPSADTGIVPDRYIIVYREAQVPADAGARVATAGFQLVQRQNHLGTATVAKSANRSAAVSKATGLSEDTETMRQLAAQPGVGYVFHDRIVTAHRLRIRLPSFEEVFSVATGSAGFDTYYNSPQGWAVRQVGGYGSSIAGGPANGPWDTTLGQGVRIAILDSGVDGMHPDLAPNLALNLSEIDKTALPSPCDDGSPQDQAGHGTWTASLAAAALGPGTGRVIGVAPRASILNIKVLERMPANIMGGTDTDRCTQGGSSGLLSWVLQGIDDAIANRADVISMSLGTIVDLSTSDGAGVKAAFDSVTYAATHAGVVLVAAAGNDGYNLSGTRFVEIPAQSRDVVAVIASTNPDCMENQRSGAACISGPSAISSYSNYGTALNAIAAPGGSYPAGGDMDVSGWIRGACSIGLSGTQDGLPNDSMHSFGCFNAGHTPYVQAIGTSASAPLVAGAVALLRAAHPSWSATTVIDVLRSTAKPATATLPAPQLDTATALAHP